MKKLLAIFAIFLLLISHLSTALFADEGNTYTFMYGTFFDAGVGSGSRFQINGITNPGVEGLAESYQTTSILSDVGNDNVIDPSENCRHGSTILCTSLGYWIGGTATCFMDIWGTTNCVPPPQPGSTAPSAGPSTPSAVCGNNTKETGEGCDDGNKTSGDGCSATCFTEHLVAEEEIPEPVCGNGSIEDSEQCDDGNLAPGDGCDAMCDLEDIEGVVLVFRAYPEKRLPATGNWANVYGVNFYVRGTRDLAFSSQLTTNNLGVGQIVTSELPKGRYDISLKGMSHLRILVPDITITGDMDIDVTHRTIPAGDLQGDNFVNALDISKLLSMLYTAQLLADLNRDGIVNALDISIMLGNLYRAGE